VTESDALEDAPAFAHRFEERVGVAQRLGVAEEQMATLTQCKVHERQGATLSLQGQINEQVPAGDDIDAGKGRISQHVLRREHHLVAQRLPDAIGLVDGLEESLQAFRRHVALDARGENAGTGERQRLVGGIGGKNFHIHDLAQAFGFFRNHHRERIGFLAAGAGDHPGANRVPRGTLGNERVDDGFAESFPGLRIAEEPGHVDHQVVGEGAGFVRPLPQAVCVVGEGRNPQQTHPAIDAPEDGRGLV
jgi:hypothetical protein